MQGGKLALNARVVLVMFAVLAALLGLAVGAWYPPPILLYGLLVAVGLGTYAAVYVIVLSVLRRSRTPRAN